MKLNEEQKPIKVGYDLDIEEDRKAIREFEAELEQLKKEPLERPMSFYGETVPVINAFKIGKREFPESQDTRRVRNDVTGLTDAGIVQYLLRNKAISRRWVKPEHPGWSWAVGPGLKAYEEFCQKKRALDDLKYRRQYAQEKDQESLDALARGRETLIKSMTPKP
ncbi:MAG: hypothetical protein HY093_03715 [Candidatus Liptonbacteria bacterium]|nr:hypothetical protein [Candidatus Liptonbacteria bacterium]